MDSNNTVLVVASSLGVDGGAWANLIDSLADSYGYRVLHARSFDEATEMLGGAHVDLVVAEQTASAPGGCEFLAGLRASYPDVTRVLAFDRAIGDLSRAAVYQFLRVPLDAEQACLVVKRGLEARELSRRHRMLSREFKLSDHAPGDGHHLSVQPASTHVKVLAGGGDQVPRKSTSNSKVAFGGITPPAPRAP